MSRFQIIFFLLLFTGCATRGEKLKSRYSFPAKKVIPVEFISQAKYHCAPASLTMLINHLGNQSTLNQVTEMLYTPEAKGTFQNDVLAATRRLGLVAIPVKKLTNVLKEINHENPVLVFQNLGLSWLPKWHYALVTGYDLNANQMILHTGEMKNFPMKISTFEKIWARVDEWGLIIVKPGTIPVTATEEDMISATAGLEHAGQLNPAITSYEKILIKWKESLGALVGLGNIYYQKDEYKKSQAYLKQATEYHPKAAGAWYNYALALYADNKLKESKFAAGKAIENAESQMIDSYKKNLGPILNSK